MASSGTTTAEGRVAVTNRASMNMPDCSSRRGFATRALAVIVRPGSCTTGSTKSTTPLNSPGERCHPEPDSLPHGQPLGEPFRHLEDGTLRVEGLERDEPRLRAHVVAEAREPAPDDAGKGRADGRAIAAEREQVELRLRAPRRGLRPLELGRGGGALVEEPLRARKRLPREIAVGLQPRDLRAELGVIHLEERRPPPHDTPLGDEDRHEPPLHLGTQLDRLHGLDLPRGVDGIDHRVSPRDDDLYRHGRHRAAAPAARAWWPAGALRGLVATAAGERAGAHEQRENGSHRVSLSLVMRRPKIASSPASASRAA